MAIRIDTNLTNLPSLQGVTAPARVQESPPARSTTEPQSSQQPTTPPVQTAGDQLAALETVDSRALQARLQRQGSAEGSTRTPGNEQPPTGSLINGFTDGQEGIEPYFASDQKEKVFSEPTGERTQSQDDRRRAS